MQQNTKLEVLKRSVEVFLYRPVSFCVMSYIYTFSLDMFSFLLLIMLKYNSAWSHTQLSQATVTA